ncbi:MAG: hypothetical protein ACOCVF_01715 [bacterium]
MATKVNLICKNCKKTFSVNKGKEKITCSNECRKELRKKEDEKFYIIKECKECSKNFKSKKKENKKYCSYVCAGKAKTKIANEIRTCKNCGNEFNVRKKQKKEFCSKTCRIMWQQKPENKKNRIEKAKIATHNKYGVDSVFKLKSYQNKIIEDRKNLSKVELENIVNKIKITKKEKYGDENYNNCKKISETKQKRYKNKNYNNRKKFLNTINDKLIKKLEKNGYKILEFLPENIVKVKHPDGHIFESPRSLLIIRYHENRELSTQYLPHSPNISNYELELQEFFKENNINYTTSNKNIISPYEIDIYLPDYKMGIEFNGLYWHSEIYKDNNYHLKKLEKSKENNINIIQIFEDEWVNNKEIVKSILKNKLGIIKNKIYARKTEIKLIDSKTYKFFLDENHIQGSTPSKIKIGLFYEKKLVSVMGFDKARKTISKKPNSFLLARFCNKIDTNVIGGASKLFKYFIKTYNPDNIISYADRRWSDGGLYYTIGFNYIHSTKPNYWYCDYRNILRIHRFNFRKSILLKEGFDKTLSEHEIMLQRGIPRIYDCGNIRFEYEKNAIG